MIEPRDFSHLSRFPGEHGNPFDVILHRLERIQSIPAIAILLLLATLAVVSARLDFSHALMMLGFFLLDWLLISSLPLIKFSFGPEKAVVLLLGILRSPFALFPLPVNLFIQCIGVILVVYSFYIEPYRLTITHQRLETEKLRGTAHLRIAHLGDLHIERLTRREKEIIISLDLYAPDLILFSGDILNLSFLNDQAAMHNAREFFSRLHASHGVFIVSGSPAVDLPVILPDLLKDLPLQWLKNEVETISVGDQSIRLIGISCSHRPHQDTQILKEIIHQKPGDEFTILLYHSPDLAPEAAAMDIDMQLSGHTHGGQFRIPGIGAIFTGSLYGRVFQSGLYKIRKMILYITRGIGMEGASAPRMRFFCPPEIIFWEISPIQK